MKPELLKVFDEKYVAKRAEGQLCYDDVMDICEAVVSEKDAEIERVNRLLKEDEQITLSAVRECARQKSVSVGHMMAYQTVCEQAAILRAEVTRLTGELDKVKEETTNELAMKYDRLLRAYGDDFCGAPICDELRKRVFGAPVAENATEPAHIAEQ